MPRRYELTDREWKLIEPYLTGLKSQAGRTGIDNRLFINAVLWIARTGMPWRALPENFGPWERTYRRFSRWAKKGLWKTIFESVQDPDLDWAMIDSTIVRGHQASAGQKKAAARATRP
jgi:transposase